MKIINKILKLLIFFSKKKLEYLQFITLMLFLSHFELDKVRFLNFLKNFFRICLRPPPSGFFSDLKMKKVENNSISRHLKQFSKEELRNKLIHIFLFFLIF